jgi:deoxyribodipyrimidine photolyase
VGEAYFAEKLDYEMASNVAIGNGQLEPVVMQHTYFRVFNPDSTEKI